MTREPTTTRPQTGSRRAARVLSMFAAVAGLAVASVAPASAQSSIPPPVERPITVVRSIAAGSDAGLVVTTGGQVYAWGTTYLSARGGVSRPEAVPGLSSIGSVSASSQQFLAVRPSRGATGSAFGWGRDWFGSLGGGGDLGAPTPLAGFGGVVDVTASADVSFALSADGHVLAVGQDSFGGLGNGPPGVDSSVPVLVTDTDGTPLSDIVEVAGGARHCWLARDAVGRVWTWGTDAWCTGGAFAAVEMPEFGPQNPAVQVAAGGAFYALTADGVVWAWGPVYGGTVSKDVKPLDGLTGVTRLDEGVAVRRDGTVWAWGFNDHGQVGLPADGQFHTPRQVQGLAGIVDVSSYGPWNMALRDDGTVWAWGAGGAGQLGNGVSADRHTPIRVTLPPVAEPGHRYLANGLFQPLVPERLADTRRPGVASSPSADLLATVPVAGRAGVRADSSGAWLNVTAANTSATGHLTVYPCDAPRPWASNLNYEPGIPIANAVAARLSDDGRACVYALRGADVVVDVNGGFGTKGYAFNALTPDRLVDTRSGGRLAADGVLRVQVAGRSGVPPGAAAAILNVTAVGAAAPGHLTVYPCDAPRPWASNVNYQTQIATPNAVAVKLAADGSACVYTLTATDVVVDVNGYFGQAGATFSGLVPSRLVDTRTTTRLAAGGVLVVDVTDHDAVLEGATAAMLNVTAVGAAAPGHLTVYPCDRPRPHASNVNYRAGNAVANSVAAPLAADGTTCIYTLAATDVVVDISGYFQ